MIKKLTALLLVFIMLVMSSMVAYATTGAAIKGEGSTKSAISGEGSTKSAISGDNDENGVTSKSAVTAKKVDFDALFKSTLANGMAADDKYSIVDITNPDKEKSLIYVNSYVLSGNTKYDDVVVSIAKYNEDTRFYEPMRNTDGETSWELGSGGAYSKLIELSKGVNKIKILSYRTSQKDEGDIQVNCFTIEYVPETNIGKITRKVTDIGSNIVEGIKGSLDGLFKDNSK